MTVKFLTAVIVLCLAFFSGCSVTLDPEEKDYYARNYDESFDATKSKGVDSEFTVKRLESIQDDVATLIGDPDLTTDDTMAAVEDLETSSKAGMSEDVTSESGASQPPAKQIFELEGDATTTGIIALYGDLITEATASDLASDLATKSDSTAQNLSQGVLSEVLLPERDASFLVVENNDSTLASQLDVNIPLTGETTEQKLFFSVLREFQNRDESKFLKFSDEFLIAYPDSEFSSRIALMRREFFYQEVFDKSLLKDNTLELGKIAIKSWQELTDNLAELKLYGLEAVVFTPFQNFGELVVPFADHNLNAGALFSSKNIYQVNDSLATLARIVKNTGLKLYIKIPVHHHSWLNLSYSHLMDQSWDFNRQRANYNLKLNLLHPEAADYLLSLIDDLARYDIAGIIIEDDYTLDTLDGMSSFNHIIYQNETGREFSATNVPKILLGERPDLVAERSVGNDFLRFNSWRASKIHLLLLDLVRGIKTRHPILKVGIELFPKLVNEPKLSWYKYSINYLQIVSLPVDFFVFGYRKTVGVDQAANHQNYFRATRLVGSKLKNNTALLLKVPTIQNSDDPPHLNARFDQVLRIAKTNNAAGFVLGPISSVKDWQLILN